MSSVRWLLISVLVMTISPALSVERLQPRHFAVWDDAKGSWSLRTQPGVWYVPIRSQSPIGASDSLVPGEPEEMPAKGLF